jgi:hypothetical protein
MAGSVAKLSTIFQKNDLPENCVPENLDVFSRMCGHRSTIPNSWRIDQAVLWQGKQPL